jgi:hypothetical protein
VTRARTLDARHAPHGARRPGRQAPRGRAIDVELLALEQLRGDQEGARVATCVDSVEGTREQALGDVGRVGAHRHDEDELRVTGRPIGQVVGEQKALARTRRDDTPAVGDRLNIHCHVIGANPRIFAPPVCTRVRDGRGERQRGLRDLFRVGRTKDRRFLGPVLLVAAGIDPGRGLAQRADRISSARDYACERTIHANPRVARHAWPAAAWPRTSPNSRAIRRLRRRGATRCRPPPIVSVPSAADRQRAVADLQTDF